ncbi:helix-turn-helix domain-containing protein [Pseudooctadecabacter jejudonensis]|uniref:Helix-turn-helix protein n=1 Tax=Pseudooctadecabacter jejudonensis TaxID=1391910 RepID=A0A1Y5TGT8_9RHOB|nr:helix-turn-helix domain-containing protein [Pseudooctadecabacter jejudonensis]SLN61648.1 helix-turn-helix protein [Pseudooctadecabacter jejudonensis]
MDDVQTQTSRVTAGHIRMARAGLNLTVRDLAEKAGVNKATIVRMEAGHAPRASSLNAVCQVLEEHGAAFDIEAETDRIIVKLST